MSSKVVGLYYEFDRSFLVIAEKAKDSEGKMKIRVTGTEYLHTSIPIIVKEVKKHIHTTKCLNKHETLAKYLGQCTQVDLKDEDVQQELNDIYKSVEADKLLVNDGSVDPSKPHHLKALSMALKISDLRSYYDKGLLGT